MEEEKMEKLGGLVNKARVYSSWIDSELNIKSKDDMQTNATFDEKSCIHFVGKLREYQVIGLNWLIGVHKNGKLLVLIIVNSQVLMVFWLMKWD
jgi:hypothetical protein